jgi:phospholipase C
MLTLKTATYTMLSLVFVTLLASPANAATLNDVRHIVIILKENHTFDNYFGSFPGADGSTTGMHEGTLLPLVRASVSPARDIPHRRAAALHAWDNRLLDDFMYPNAYAQYSESEIPAYWALARSYVLADNFFTSVMGPSFPNHLFTIFGTSFGAVDNPRHSDGTLSAKWGCDSTSDVRHICYGRDWSNVVYFQRFVRDAANGALPAVSWVVTDFANSEHPPSDVRVGEALSEAMVDAVQRGPDAASTVVFVSWDDYGGGTIMSRRRRWMRPDTVCECR